MVTQFSDLQKPNTVNSGFGCCFTKGWNIYNHPFCGIYECQTDANWQDAGSGLEAEICQYD